MDENTSSFYVLRVLEYTVFDRLRVWCGWQVGMTDLRMTPETDMSALDIIIKLYVQRS